MISANNNLYHKRRTNSYLQYLERFSLSLKRLKSMSYRKMLTIYFYRDRTLENFVLLFMCAFSIWPPFDKEEKVAVL